MEATGAPARGPDGTLGEGAAPPPRPPSISFVTPSSDHTVTLNPGGTISDIVLLQGRAGNPVTVADLLAANPQYTDVTRIPAGAALSVPVRSGDVLSIYRADGAVETINTRTAEITSTTLDAQGNTHQVISRPDGESGRLYVERTLHAGTGEVVSSSAVRVDTLSGQATAIDPVTLQPVDAIGAGGGQSEAPDGFTPLSPEEIEALGTPPAPGAPIAVIADGGNGTQTDAGPVNGYGDASPPLPSSSSPFTPPQEAANGFLSLGELAGQLSPGQTQSLLLALTQQGLTPEALGGVAVYTNPDGSRLLANEEGDIIGTLDGGGSGGAGAEGQWVQLQLLGQEALYLGPQGQALNEQSYQLHHTEASLNFVQSLLGLQNWSALNDAQRLNTLATLYNQMDTLGNLGATGGLPGNIGEQVDGYAGILSLVSGIENDNALQTLVGGIQLGNAVGSMLGNGSMVVSDAIGSAMGVSAGQVVPVLNLIIALDNIEENPVGAVTAALSMMGPYGQIAALVLTVISMFMDNDIPPSIGEAEVSLDASGAVVVNTTRDEAGGGGTAAGWAQALAELAVSAGMSAPQAGAPAQIQCVPAPVNNAMGASHHGPQIPRGLDPIVLVPVQGSTSRWQRPIGCLRGDKSDERWNRPAQRMSLKGCISVNFPVDQCPK